MGHDTMIRNRIELLATCSIKSRFFESESSSHSTSGQVLVMLKVLVHVVSDITSAFQSFLISTSVIHMIEEVENLSLGRRPILDPPLEELRR